MKSTQSFQIMNLDFDWEDLTVHGKELHAPVLVQGIPYTLTIKVMHLIL